MTILGAFLFMILRSSERPDLLPAIAGCFQSSGFPVRSEVRIDRAGEFVARTFHTAIVVDQDKNGLFLLPKRDRQAIVMEYFQNIGPALESHYPQEIRLSPDLRSFDIPSNDGASVSFERFRCPA